MWVQVKSPVGQKPMVKSPMVKSPVGQKPYDQMPGWSKAPTNKHLNFKTNLLDIYTCNISESLPSDDVSNALQCLYKCFIVIIVCLAQIEESIL